MHSSDCTVSLHCRKLNSFISSCFVAHFYLAACRSVDILEANNVHESTQFVFPFHYYNVSVLFISSSNIDRWFTSKVHLNKRTPSSSNICSLTEKGKRKYLVEATKVTYPHVQLTFRFMYKQSNGLDQICTNSKLCICCVLKYIFRGHFAMDILVLPFRTLLSS